MEDHPTFAFVGGSLHIREGQIARTVTAWPRPRARVRVGARRATAFVPRFRLVGRSVSGGSGPVAEQQLAFSFGAPGPIRVRPPAAAAPRTVLQARKRAFDALRASLPEPVAAALERFRTGQWRLLQLLAHDPSMVDLANDAPVLTYLVAQRLRGDVRLIRSASFGRRRRPDLLAWLGLPASRAMVRRLGRIEGTVVERVGWRTVVQVLGSDDPRVHRRLAHVTRVNVGVLALLSHPRLLDIVTPGLLEQVASAPEERRRAVAGPELIQLLSMRRVLPHLRPIRKITSLEQLHQLHTESRRALQDIAQRARKLRQKGRHNFANPPLPGIPGRIEPIDSPKGLVEESCVQRNCVDGYVDQVASGRTYIYRVLSPERATLSLIQGPRGEWRRGELLAKANRAVRPSTYAMVDAWLEQCGF